jgi:signal transduction histidine kinase
MGAEAWRKFSGRWRKFSGRWRNVWGPLREATGTVRVRTTMAAVVVVGIALLIAAAALVVLLRRSIKEDIRAAALLLAESVTADLEDPRRRLRIPGEREADKQWVQILDREGRVVGSSRNLKSEHANVAIARFTLKAAEANASTTVKVPYIDDEETFLAVADSARYDPDAQERVTSETTGPVRIVVVGLSMEDVNQLSRIVIGFLVAGIPVLLVIVGAVTWRVAGRALGPVEAIRTEVESISTRDLYRRVPEPAGKDEISRLAMTMNRMLGRLERGQERQRRFVSDASHELRSPVATIRQHSEVAQAHPDGTTVRELADVVLEEERRLQRLIEDLLLLTKMDEGTLQLRKDLVDVDDLLFEEANRLRATTTFRVDVSDVSAGRVMGDRRQLNQLVRNLVDNAAHHAQGAIALRLREANGAVVLIVDDDGRGIPPSERDRVFERFVRLDEARDRNSGGSGLGLAIVAEIAGAHGGRVAVADAPLGGARVEVHLPTSTS